MPEKQSDLPGMPAPHGVEGFPDAVPDSIMRDLQLVMGEMPAAGQADSPAPDSVLDSATLTGDSLKDRAADDPTGPDARTRFLRSREKSAASIRTCEYQVAVFDLAIKSEAQEFADLCNEAGDPKNNLKLQVTSPVPLLDPKASRGFRTLVTTKLFKVVTDVVVKPHGYTEVSDTKVRQQEL